LNYKNVENQGIFEWFTNKHEGEEGYIPFPNSFETVGHMAHYNLTDQQIPFDKVIGEITLLKCPNIKTAVNKTEKLHNVYRTPTLEHMSGLRDYLVKLKEQGVQF
jgi:tRNA (guanine37-N1)-methyltransferase